MSKRMYMYRVYTRVQAQGMQLVSDSINIRMSTHMATSRKAPKVTASCVAPIDMLRLFNKSTTESDPSDPAELQTYVERQCERD